MLLTKYEQDDLLFNKNFLEKCSKDGMQGYRGELVLVKGEVADANGRTKPPISLIRSAVLLSEGEKLKFVVGFLDEMDLLATFIEKYQQDFADDMKALFYVVNATRPMRIAINNASVVIIPMVEGVAWNELIDELALEKSDFKGQSSADKILTAYTAFCSYKPKYAEVPLNDAYANVADIKREARGAV